MAQLCVPLLMVLGQTTFTRKTVEYCYFLNLVCVSVREKEREREREGGCISVLHDSEQYKQEETQCVKLILAVATLFHTIPSGLFLNIKI